MGPTDPGLGTYILGVDLLYYAHLFAMWTAPGFFLVDVLIKKKGYYDRDDDDKKPYVDAAHPMPLVGKQKRDNKYKNDFGQDHTERHWGKKTS